MNTRKRRPTDTEDFSIDNSNNKVANLWIHIRNRIFHSHAKRDIRLSAT